MYVLILFFFALEWKKYLPVVLLVFSPFLVNYLLNAITWSGLGGRGYILFPGVMLSILLTYFTLEKADVPFLAGVQKTAAVYAGAIILTVIFCAAYVLGYYGYVYRDGPVSALTYKMERGVFKGLYTVEGRGKALIRLEDEIQKVTDKQDMVMFRDQAPQAYLMTKAKHCAPSTWDILLYPYAYNNSLDENYDSMDDSLLHEYFRTVGREPNKIIYVQDKERLEHLSLRDENYRFNQYVDRCYTQTYANNEEHFAIIVFERNSP